MVLGTTISIGSMFDLDSRKMQPTEQIFQQISTDLDQLTWTL